MRNNAPSFDIEIDEIKQGEYDLFFAVCANLWDFRYVAFSESLQAKCRRAVCLISEFWPQQIDELLPHLDVVRRFDYLFCNIESSVEPIEKMTQRPCHFLPGGVDAVRFCPYPGRPRRGVDFYSIGRRPDAVHRVLSGLAEQQGKFYIHDTMSDFGVIDPKDHRCLLANLIKRSRYFLAYPAKFDAPSETLGQQEIGFRFFEGAAGGAVMLGQAPRCASFGNYFDWPDPVISTELDGTQLAGLVADLDAQPARLAQIRRESMAGSLLRHDWVYRWRQILEAIDFPCLQGAIEREGRLATLAEMVRADKEPLDDGGGVPSRLGYFWGTAMP